MKTEDTDALGSQRAKLTKPQSKNKLPWLTRPGNGLANGVLVHNT